MPTHRCIPIATLVCFGAAHSPHAHSLVRSSRHVQLCEFLAGLPEAVQLVRLTPDQLCSYQCTFTAEKGICPRHIIHNV